MTILSEQQDFVQYLLSEVGELAERFEPFASYNPDGDCIHFFISDRKYYGKRVDDFLTLYLDMKTDEIVGSVIKNVRCLCKMLSEGCRSISFIVENDKVQLQHLFQRQAEELDDSTEAGVYRRLAEIAEKNQIKPVNLLCA